MHVFFSYDVDDAELFGDDDLDSMDPNPNNSTRSFEVWIPTILGLQ